MEAVLRESLANFTRSTKYQVKVRVEEQMCQVYESPLNKIDSGTVYALVFFGLVLTMALAMTVYDVLVPESDDKSECGHRFQLANHYNN